MRVWIFLIALLPIVSQARTRANDIPLDSSSTRGVFSAGLYYGDSFPRLLNSDGSISSYRGSEFGVLLDLSAMVGSGSDFRFFLQGGQKSARGVQNPADSLLGTQWLAGMKAFPLSWFFVSAGIGQLSATARTSSDSVSLSSPMTALGGGLELHMAGDIYLGIYGWYKSGVLRANENPSLAGNSFTDTLDVIAVFIWCPSSSTTNVFKRGRD